MKTLLKENEMRPVVVDVPGLPYPGRHGVGLRGAKVNVEDHDGDADTAIGLLMRTENPVTSHLNVSRIIVKRTNFPSKGTTREVGGMISASRRKKTVRERRMLMERLTCNKQLRSD